MKWAWVTLPLLAVVLLAQTRAPQELWGGIFSTFAPSDGQVVPWHMNASGQLGTDIVTGPSQFLLLANGIDFLLLVDGTSKVCLASSGSC